MESREDHSQPARRVFNFRSSGVAVAVDVLRVRSVYSL
jgi:hypothetical protein